MAGIMDRLTRLVRANINDLIDQAEDPEKMIDQIIREMQESIVTARSQVAAMIAQEKELELEVAETSKLASEWGRKAERAVTAGKDDLAREALRRKRDNDENSAILTCSFDERWPFGGRVVQYVRVEPRRLVQKLAVEADQRSFPASIGWHPWFARRSTEPSSCCPSRRTQRCRHAKRSSAPNRCSGTSGT